jgi:hypothetical protein
MVVCRTACPGLPSHVSASSRNYAGRPGRCLKENNDFRDGCRTGENRRRTRIVRHKPRAERAADPRVCSAVRPDEIFSNQGRDACFPASLVKIKKCPAPDGLSDLMRVAAKFEAKEC